MADISVEQISALNANLSTLTKTLKQFDQEVVSSARLISTFDRAFGDIKNFERFKVAVNQFGDRQTRNFQVIAKGLTDIARAVRVMPKDTNTILDSIGDSLIDLKAGINAFSNIDTKRLTKFFDTLTNFMNKLSQIRPISDQQRLSLNAVAGIIRTFAKLGDGISDKDISSVEKTLVGPDGAGGMFGVIKKVFESLSELTSLNAGAEGKSSQNITTSLNAVGDIISAFIRLSKNREDLQLNDINATGFDRIFDVIRLLTREVSKFSGNLRVDPASIKAIRETVKLLVDFLLGQKEGESGSIFKLAEIAEGLPSLDTTRLFVFTQKFGKLAPVFDLFKKITRELSDAVAGFGAGTDLSGVSKLIVAFKELVKFVPELFQISADLPKANAETFGEKMKAFLRIESQLAPLFTAIKKIFSELSRIGGNIDTGSANALAGLATAFQALVKFIPELFEIAGKLPQTDGSGFGAKMKVFLETTNELTPIFNVLSIVVDKISKIAKKVGKSDGISSSSLQNISTLIDSIGKFATALPKLIKVATNFPSLRGSVLINKLRPLAKLDPLFAILQRFAKETSKISLKTRDGGDLSGIGTLTESMSRFAFALPKILKLSKEIPGGISPKGLLARFRRFRELSKVFGILKQIVQQLEGVAGGVKDPKNLKQFTETIKDLFSFLKASVDTADADIKFPELSGFEKFIDQLIKGLGRLSGSNIDTAKVEAALKSVKQFSEVTGKGLSVQGGGGLFGASASGIFNTEIIEVFTRKLISSLEKATNSVINFRQIAIDNLERVGQSFINAGQEISEVGERILQRVSLKALAESAAVGVAAEFDDLSQQIKVFASNIPLDEAQEFANLIGIQYPLSANEALAATLDLAKAGQDFASIGSILPTAADLAALSETGDLEAATQFLIAAESAFPTFRDGVDATFGNVSEAADVVFQAANDSTASIDSMFKALNKAAPAASQFGVSLAETAATITIFEDANIRGSEAGNIFNTVLAEISKPKAREELTRLDIAFQNIDGSLRPLSQIIPDIKQRFDDLNLTQVEVQRSLREIGGDVLGVRGLSILLNTQQSIKDITDSFDDQGSAGLAAQKLLESYTGQVEQLQGSFETLLKEGALPLIKNFFTPFVKIARAAVDAMLRLPQGVIETVSTFILLGTAIATVVGGLLILVGTLTALGGVVITASARILQLAVISFPKLVAGIGLFTASLATALFTLAIFSTALFAVSNTVQRFFKVIQVEGSVQQKAFQDLSDSAKEAFGEIVRIVKLSLAVLESAFGFLFGGDQGDIAFSGITKGLVSLSDALKDFTARAKEVSLEDIIDSILKLNNVIEPIVSGFAQTGVGLFQLLLGDTSAVAGINSGISSISFGLTNLIQNLTGGDFTRALVNFEAGDFALGLSDFFEEIRNVVETFLTNNEENVKNISKFLVRLFNPFSKIGSILDFLGLDPLAQIFTNIGTTINEGITGLIDVALTAVSGGNIQAAIEENFGELAGEINLFVLEISRAVGVVKDIIDLFFSLFSAPVGEGATDQFGETVKRVLGQIAEVVALFTDNILVPLRDNLPRILHGVSTFIRSLVADFQPLVVWVEFVGEAVSNLIETFGKLLEGTITAEDAFRSLVENIAGIIVNLPRALGATLSNIGDTIGSTFLSSIGEAFSRGDFFEVASIIINGILSSISSLLKQIPKALLSLGRTLDSDFLIKLGEALIGERGDAIAILGEGILTFIRDGIEFAFNTLVDIFDEFLDQFDDRVVGGIVLSLSGLVISALLIFVKGLPAILLKVGFTGAIQSAVQAIVGKLGLGILAGVLGPGTVLLLAAALTGVLATLIFTVFNDPDVSIIRGSARRIVDTFEEEMEDRAARSDLDKVIFGTLSTAFSGTRIGDQLGAVTDTIAVDLGTQLRNSLGSVFGRESFLTNVIVANLQQPIEALASIFRGIAVLARGFIANIAGALEILRSIIDTLVRKLKPVFDFIVNLVKALGELAKIMVIVTVAVGLAVVAFKLFTRAAAASATASTASALSSSADATAKLAQAGATNIAAVATGRFNISLKGILKTLGKAAAIFILFQAATVVLEGIGDALVKAEEKGSAAGLVELFRSISVSTLEILGLSDLIPQVEENFRLLEIIAIHFADAVGFAFQVIINSIISGFEDIRARLEIFAADTLNTAPALEAEEFFDFQDLITEQFAFSEDKNRGALEGFFTKLYGSIESASDPAALVRLLGANTNLIQDEFVRLVELFPDFEEFGSLDQVVQLLDDVGSLKFAFEVDNQSVKGLSSLAIVAFNEGLLTSDLGATFVEEVFGTGDIIEDFSKLGKRDATFYAQNFLDFLASGVLTEEEATQLLDPLGFEFIKKGSEYIIVVTEMADETRAANFVFADMFDAIERLNVADLTEQFNDGTLALDDYVRALTEANSSLAELNAEVVTNELTTLNQALSEEGLSDNQFIIASTDLFASALEDGLATIEEERGALGVAFANGFITDEELARQAEILDNQIDTLTLDIEQQRALIPLRVEFKTNLDDPEFVRRATRVLKEVSDKFKEVNKGEGDGAKDFSDDIKDSQEEVEGLVGDAQEALDAITEAQEEFADNVTKINEKFVKDEAKIFSRIDKNRTDSLRDAAEDQEDFQIAEEESREDHNEKLLQIDKSGSEQIQDAVANRDSAAAQQAVKNRDRQTLDEQAAFKKAEERSKAGFDLDQERANQRTALREQELFEDLKLIGIERDQKIAAERAKLAEIQLANKVALSAEAAFNKARVDLTQTALQTMLKMLKEFSPEAVKLIENGSTVIGALVEVTGNSLMTFVSQVQRNISRLLSQQVTSSVNALNSFIGSVQSQTASGSASLASQQAIIVNQSEQGSGGAFIDSSFMSFGGPRAEGGNIDPLRFFEVQDTKRDVPEIFSQGGRTFLIPGRAGSIRPPSRLPAGAMGGGVNVTVDLSGMNISGISGDPVEIATMIETRVVNGLRDVLQNVNTERKGF